MIVTILQENFLSAVSRASRIVSAKPQLPITQNILLKTEDGKLKAEAKPEDTAMEMQRQMAMITPLMFGMFAYQFPLGLALYWNVFGLFGIIQQLNVNKKT